MMAKVEAIPIERAAVLEGLSYAAMKKRLQRRATVLLPDRSDRRCKLVPIAALSLNARSQFYKDEAQAALAGLQTPGPPEETVQLPARKDSQSLELLPFAPTTATEHALSEGMPPAIPNRHKDYVAKWAGIIGDCVNGTWKLHRGKLFGGFTINGRGDYIRALAHMHDISIATIKAKLTLYRQIQRDPAIPPNRKEVAFWEQLVPKPRPGRSGHTFFHQPENDWMGPKLQSLYLAQAKLSVKRAHELLLAEIEKKQAAQGIGHRYQRPTLHQSRIYLSKIDKATLTLAREGEKAYNDRCAPYISRRNNLHPNQLWVTDQKLYDVRLRDGGERLGRVWGVNVLDVASWRWLGGAVGPCLSADLVMYAYAMALERAGVPRAVHIDLGKECWNHRFHDPADRMFLVSAETLFGHTIGLWDRLGVRVVKAIGRNPQSKIIERWHSEIDRWTHELPGCCGSDPDERPEALAVQEAEHAAWLAGRAPRSPLLRADTFIREFFAWAEGRWNVGHRGRGKYLQGMTPNEAWNTRLPAEGLQKLTRDQVDYYTADRRFVKIARGGQVNLTFYGYTVEYIAPELFSRQGEMVEVLVPRTNPRQVTVIYRVPGGTESCMASLKPQHEWLPENREELRLALRCRAAARRAIKRGIEATHALDEADSPLELLEATSAHSFGAPRRLLPPRRGKARFADQRGNAVVATLEEEA